jgi:hypothetical protein
MGSNNAYPYFSRTFCKNDNHPAQVEDAQSPHHRILASNYNTSSEIHLKISIREIIIPSQDLGHETESSFNPKIM